jgi:hypothetical protein
MDDWTVFMMDYGLYEGEVIWAGTKGRDINGGHAMQCQAATYECTTPHQWVAQAPPSAMVLDFRVTKPATVGTVQVPPGQLMAVFLFKTSLNFDALPTSQARQGGIV